MIRDSNNISNQLHNYATQSLQAANHSIEEQGGVSEMLWGLASKVAEIGLNSLTTAVLNTVTGGGYSMGVTLKEAYDIYATSGTESKALANRENTVKQIRNHQARLASSDSFVTNKGQACYGFNYCTKRNRRGGKTIISR